MLLSVLLLLGVAVGVVEASEVVLPLVSLVFVFELVGSFLFLPATVLACGRVCLISLTFFMSSSFSHSITLHGDSLSSFACSTNLM